MIRLLRTGTYRLIETKTPTKILRLDGRQSFAWIKTERVGHLLIHTHRPHVADHLLATGPYRLYEVENEAALTPKCHLELFVGSRRWQSYLLSELPSKTRPRVRLSPTQEVISATRRQLLLANSS